MAHLEELLRGQLETKEAVDSLRQDLRQFAVPLMGTIQEVRVAGSIKLKTLTH